MDDVARWPAPERAELFEETSARAGMPAAVVVEKDFWVCWTLRHVFGPAPIVPGMVFKGGTSLSKAYGAITRFSEDVDLSIPRAALGFADERDLTPGVSNTRAGRLRAAMVAACDAYVGGTLRAELARRMAAALGRDHGARGSTPGDVHEHLGLLAVDPADPGTLLLRYPTALPDTAYGARAYIRPVVRLEFGGRNEVWPAERRVIRAYALAAFPHVVAEGDVAVDVLAAERTFWEKATILHAEYHRPVPSARGDRLSRHYADLAALAGGDVGTRALARPDLLAAVAAHKARYFPASWARYPDATPGTLRLVPHPELERALRRDYAAMRDMFFDEPEPFDTVLAALAALERAINASGPTRPPS